jgi:hypothetical protein
VFSAASKTIVGAFDSRIVSPVCSIDFLDARVRYAQILSHSPLPSTPAETYYIFDRSKITVSLAAGAKSCRNRKQPSQKPFQAHVPSLWQDSNPACPVNF